MGDQGDFDAAHMCFDEALDGLSGNHHQVESSVLCWKSGVLLWQGRWADAKAVAEAATQIAEKVRSIYLIDMSLSLRGYAEWRLGYGEEAAARIEHATARLEVGDKKLFVSLNYGWLAHIMAARSDWAGLRSAVAQSVSRERQMDVLGVGMAYRLLA